MRLHAQDASWRNFLRDVARGIQRGPKLQTWMRPFCTATTRPSRSQPLYRSLEAQSRQDIVGSEGAGRIDLVLDELRG